jgi:hypothetical protein
VDSGLLIEIILKVDICLRWGDFLKSGLSEITCSKLCPSISLLIVPFKITFGTTTD